MDQPKGKIMRHEKRDIYHFERPPRVLITGDRHWTSAAVIERELRLLIAANKKWPLKLWTLIHGDARGADRIGAAVAEALGMKAVAFPADWQRFGPGAGPIRNQQMLDEGRPEFVLAFHSDITKSKGTRDMLRRCEALGLPFVLIVH